MCRVLQAIENTKEKLAQIALSRDKREELSESLNMNLEEFCHFQTLKSAVMGSQLTLTEASVIYQLLGPNPNVFNGQPLEVKMVLTQVFKELLTKEIQSC